MFWEVLLPEWQKYFSNCLTLNNSTQKPDVLVLTCREWTFRNMSTVFSSPEFSVHRHLVKTKGGVCCWPHHWSWPIRNLRGSDSGWILQGEKTFISIFYYMFFLPEDGTLYTVKCVCVCRNWTMTTFRCSTPQPSTFLTWSLLWHRTVKSSESMDRHMMWCCCWKRYSHTRIHIHTLL